MKTASLGQFGNLDFAFLNLKQHSSELDKEISKELKNLEKLIKNALSSRKKPEAELELLLPKLFEFRLKALQWMADEGESIDNVLDSVYTSIEELGTNSKLKKIGYHISHSLIYNRQLVAFFSESGALNEKTINSLALSKLTYTSYLVSLQLIPGQIRSLMIGLLTTSLYIEFLSITSVMINMKEVTCSDFKINQLTSLASETSIKYMGYVSHLLHMAKAEMFFEERNEWTNFSSQQLNNAYSEDEPDIENLKVKEPNPEYGL